MIESYLVYMLFIDGVAHLHFKHFLSKYSNSTSLS